VRDERYRALPKVDLLAAHPSLGAYAPAVRTAAARDAVAAARTALSEGRPLPDVAADALERARALDGGRLRPVINATGVVVHTNLGRAPWSASARAAAARAAGACDLEVDLASGARGGRLRGAADQLRHLVGAEATLVVNNCAAAVLLALTALAAGREVVVSRGELVEIGGAFRVPDVIASGGARLVEVGTTNRTRAADYAAAVGPATAVLLKVHPSNFRIEGFVEEAPRTELAALARARGIALVEDLGSGLLSAAGGELGVREVLAAGVDLVTFSGDKLLGGPQAGVVCGRADLVATLARHPLYRALRVDKVTLAALEATLGDHLAGRPPPVRAALDLSPAALRQRAQDLVARLGWGEVAPLDGQVGGGSLPGEVLPSFGLRWATDDAESAARALRAGEPAVLVRVHRGAVLVDVRAVGDHEIEALAARLSAVRSTR
jgi:L-seryl-tRNA(Ser) seleniumtransferase